MTKTVKISTQNLEDYMREIELSAVSLFQQGFYIILLHGNDRQTVEQNLSLPEADWEKTCTCSKQECKATSWGKHPHNGYSQSFEYGKYVKSVREIFEWRKQYPNGDYNLGVITGILSKKNSDGSTSLLPGLYVVDTDDAKADSYFRSLAKKHGIDVEAASTVITGNGHHYWFRVRPVRGRDANYARNSTRIDGYRLDVRAHGGLAVVPPSYHRNGINYFWEGNQPSSLDDLPEISTSFLKLVRKHRKTAHASSLVKKSVHTATETKATHLTRVDITKLRFDEDQQKISDGARNTFLYEAARRLNFLPKSMLKEAVRALDATLCQPTYKSSGGSISELVHYALKADKLQPSTKDVVLALGKNLVAYKDRKHSTTFGVLPDETDLRVTYDTRDPMWAASVRGAIYQYGITNRTHLVVEDVRNMVDTYASDKRTVVRRRFGIGAIDLGDRIYDYVDDMELEKLVASSAGGAKNPKSDRAMYFKGIASDRKQEFFVRNSDFAKLPTPEFDSRRANDRLREFRQLLRLDDHNFTLVMSWLMSTMLPIHTGYPILFLTGSEDSGKSTIGYILRFLIDPKSEDFDTDNAEEFVDDPQVLRRLFNDSHVIFFDNVSRIAKDTADLLCRASTGGRVQEKMHYSNGKNYKFPINNPIIIATVEPSLTDQSDFLSRCLVIDVNRESGKSADIDSALSKRKKLDYVRTEITRLRPYILGSLLRAAEQALRNPSEHYVRGNRFMDALSWSCGGAKFLGLASDKDAKFGTAEAVEKIKAAYKENVHTSYKSLLVNPVTQALYTELSENAQSYEAITEENLVESLRKKHFSKLSHEARARCRDWPEKSTLVMSVIKMSVKVFRRLGLEIEMNNLTTLGSSVYGFKVKSAKFRNYTNPSQLLPLTYNQLTKDLQNAYLICNWSATTLGPGKRSIPTGAWYL